MGYVQDDIMSLINNYLFRAQFLFLGHFQSKEHLNILFPGVAGLETAHTGNFSYTIKRIRDLTIPTN